MGYEPTFGKTISQRIMLAPKRERGDCAFRKCCEQKCFTQIRRACTHIRTKEEMVKAVSLRVERMNLLSENREGNTFEARDRVAGKLAQMLQGSAVPIDYGGTIDYSFCGDTAKIQTYSIDEMRGMLSGIPIEVSGHCASVSAFRKDRPTGLSENYSDLFAWIAAIRIIDERQMGNLIRIGGVNGIRAIARIIGEPSIDEKTRSGFMKALCEISACLITDEEGNLLGDKRLAAEVSRFSTLEAYYFTSSGAERKREFGGLMLPPPNFTPKPHMMRQMSLVAISGLFQASMNLANRIDSIISSGDKEVEENAERMRGMYESLKIGLRCLLDGKAASPRTMEFFADMKITQLYGSDTPRADRGLGMDPGEQNIAKYAVSRLMGETRLDVMVLEQFYRMLPASESCPKETEEKMDRHLSA